MAKILAISGRNLKVEEGDGKVIKYLIAKNSIVRLNGQPARLSQLDNDDEVTISGRTTQGYQNVEATRDEKVAAKRREARVRGVVEEKVEDQEVTDDGRKVVTKSPKVKASKISPHSNKQHLANTGGDGGGAQLRHDPKNYADDNEVDPDNDPDLSRSGTDEDEHNEGETKTESKTKHDVKVKSGNKSKVTAKPLAKKRSGG